MTDRARDATETSGDESADFAIKFADALMRRCSMPWVRVTFGAAGSIEVELPGAKDKSWSTEGFTVPPQDWLPWA